MQTKEHMLLKGCGASISDSCAFFDVLGSLLGGARRGLGVRAHVWVDKGKRWRVRSTISGLPKGIFRKREMLCCGRWRVLNSKDEYGYFRRLTEGGAVLARGGLC